MINKDDLLGLYGQNPLYQPPKLENNNTPLSSFVPMVNQPPTVNIQPKKEEKKKGLNEMLGIFTQQQLSKIPESEIKGESKPESPLSKTLKQPEGWGKGGGR